MIFDTWIFNFFDVSAEHTIWDEDCTCGICFESELCSLWAFCVLKIKIFPNISRKQCLSAEKVDSRSLIRWQEQGKLCSIILLVYPRLKSCVARKFSIMFPKYWPYKILFQSFLEYWFPTFWILCVEWLRIFRSFRPIVFVTFFFHSAFHFSKFESDCFSWFFRTVINLFCVFD